MSEHDYLGINTETLGTEEVLKAALQLIGTGELVTVEQVTDELPGMDSYSLLDCARVEDRLRMLDEEGKLRQLDEYWTLPWDDGKLLLND